MQMGVPKRRLKPWLHRETAWISRTSCETLQAVGTLLNWSKLESRGKNRIQCFKGLSVGNSLQDFTGQQGIPDSLILQARRARLTPE